MPSRQKCSRGKQTYNVDSAEKYEHVQIVLSSNASGLQTQAKQAQ
jgi:hypothetical protein